MYHGPRQVGASIWDILSCSESPLNSILPAGPNPALSFQNRADMVGLDRHLMTSPLSSLAIASLNMTSSSGAWVGTLNKLNNRIMNMLTNDQNNKFLLP